MELEANYTCMKELLMEGGGIELARVECLDMERWRLFCRSHPFGDVSGGNKV